MLAGIPLTLRHERHACILHLGRNTRVVWHLSWNRLWSVANACSQKLTLFCLDLCNLFLKTMLHWLCHFLAVWPWVIPLPPWTCFCLWRRTSCRALCDSYVSCYCSTRTVNRAVSSQQLWSTLSHGEAQKSLPSSVALQTSVAFLLSFTAVSNCTSSRWGSRMRPHPESAFPDIWVLGLQLEICLPQECVSCVLYC